MAAQKALELDFGELAGILKGPELIGAYFVKLAEIVAGLHIVDLLSLQRLRIQVGDYHSRQWSTLCSGFSVVDPFPRTAH